MDLGPLREAEAIELASGFFDTKNRLVQDCIARAEGNPLFLEQLLRNAGESEQAQLPASIQSLVLARMDRLPAEDKRALQFKVDPDVIARSSSACGSVGSRQRFSSSQSSRRANNAVSYRQGESVRR